jgi:hypothetical protein
MVTFPGERIVMTSPCRLLTTVFLAASAAALALPASAAPIAAPSSSPVVPTLSVETVQWWGGGPYYEYYAPGYGYGYSWNPGGSLPAPGYAPVPSNAPMPGYAPCARLREWLSSRRRGCRLLHGALPFLRSGFAHLYGPRPPPPSVSAVMQRAQRL